MSQAGGNQGEAEAVIYAPQDGAGRQRSFGHGGDHAVIEHAAGARGDRSTAKDAAARILDSAEGLLALADKEEAEKAQKASCQS